MNINWFYALAL